ncbi:DUF3325 domain-containing protein [Undibacterium sp. CY18W]|uniref:DUF3325 domain-containing protein n=1 Tax=Undibacterium hunanense TaxID=2762292 RepID=A0ABR6ZMM3_9BURK|nr:DUF3325 domain-containing protein [Undibacterium hunanense]MBC3917132.1 DUF3325 domain-containing protein [Undibacterium hunanense]
MLNALLLFAALAANVAGMGWLALAMEVHWEQVRGTSPQPARLVNRLRWLGAAGLGTSLLLCLRVDHASMASLVWVMALAVAAVSIAFTLTWRPRWLRALVIWA